MSNMLFRASSSISFFLIAKGYVYDRELICLNEERMMVMNAIVLPNPVWTMNGREERCFCGIHVLCIGR